MMDDHTHVSPIVHPGQSAKVITGVYSGEYEQKQGTCIIQVQICCECKENVLQSPQLCGEIWLGAMLSDGGGGEGTASPVHLLRASLASPCFITATGTLF